MDSKSPEELLQGLLPLPQKFITHVVKVACKLFAWEGLGPESRGQKSGTISRLHPQF